MSVTEYQDTDEKVISSGWVTAIAIVMIVLGIIAIAFPFFATIASTVLFGWIWGEMSNRTENYAKAEILIMYALNPHSARNGKEKTITKQVQGGNSSVGRQKKRNVKCEDEGETN